MNYTLPRFSRATIPLLLYLLDCFLCFVRIYFTENIGILEYNSLTNLLLALATSPELPLLPALGRMLKLVAGEGLEPPSSRV